MKPLDGAHPISKKKACEILNINYNTIRLGKIIEEFKEHETFVATRKAQNRGKSATPEEITETITEYLSGEPVSEIAKGLFRSAGFINGIIKRIGVPYRASKTDRGRVGELPEESMAESFRRGQVVWSAKYYSPAIIIKEMEDPLYLDKYNSKCYQVSIIEQVDATDSFFKHITAGGFTAHCLAYDLGSLEHLKEHGVDLNKI